MPAGFDAVLFDCDGVLVDSEAQGLQASADYLQAHGLNFGPADLVRDFTGLRDDFFAERLSAAYRAANGASPPSGFFEGLIEARRRCSTALAPIKGAATALVAAGPLRAVASSSRAHLLEAKLRRTGLYDLAAPHVYSADRVAHGKPHPDIFLFAAAQLGVRPERCLVIEDSAFGVTAGRRAGMTVWGFLGGGHCFDGHGGRLRDAGASIIMADFEAVIAAWSGA